MLNYTHLALNSYIWERSVENHHHCHSYTHTIGCICNALQHNVILCDFMWLYYSLLINDYIWLYYSLLINELINSCLCHLKSEEPSKAITMLKMILYLFSCISLQGCTYIANKDVHLIHLLWCVDAYQSVLKCTVTIIKQLTIFILFLNIGWPQPGFLSNNLPNIILNVAEAFYEEFL